MLLYPSNQNNWNLDLAKAPGFDHPKEAPYYNMEPLSDVKSRELSLKSKTNYSGYLGIHSLHLRFFRLYEDQRIHFFPGVNVFHGPNATGKTTILEALYLFLTGRSFRSSQATEWIQHGSEWSSLELNFEKYGIEGQLKIVQNLKGRQIYYNQTLLESISSLLGILPGVIMTPDDVALIKGAPQLRRHFLDLQIAQVDPLYVHHLTRYMRAMRQRNALLKQKRLETIENWEAEMAQAAAYIITKRFFKVEALSQKTLSCYSNLSESKEKFTLHYITGVKHPNDGEKVKRELMEKYHHLRKRELDMGFSLMGPHRDDLEIMLDEKEAKFFASEGQQRTIVAALRMAEWEELSLLTESQPLMMIDDVGLGLDEKRKQKLFNSLNQMGQVFITSTEMPEFG